MTNEDKEVWKIYPEYSFIEVSNLGRVRTKDRTVTDKNGNKRLIKGRILKQNNNGNGYMYMQFSMNSKPVHLYTHRMVAICFLPNPNNFPQVNHIDCDRTNNAVSNLEWCSQEYNNAYREKYGTACNRSVIAVNQETSEVFLFKSQHEAAHQLGIDNSSINMVVKGKQNKTHGWWFTYANENAVEKARAKFGDKIAKKVRELMKGEGLS